MRAASRRISFGAPSSTCHRGDESRVRTFTGRGRTRSPLLGWTGTADATVAVARAWKRQRALTLPVPSSELNARDGGLLCRRLLGADLLRALDLDLDPSLPGVDRHLVAGID